MSTSTDAILVYGIDLGDEEDIEYPEQYGDFYDFTEDVYERRVRHGVDLTRHCSDECTMFILAAEGTEQRASRGYLIEVDPKTLVVPDEVDQKLREACERYGFEWSEPRWYLVSYWG